MQIEAIHSEAQLQHLFQHIQTTWQSLGETEPYWSVLSADQFTQTHIEATKEAFYHSGQYAADLLFNTLRRHNIEPTSFTSCLEYGCGLGRVTRWLAEHFAYVVGYDISQSHLQYAQAYLNEQGLHNVAVHHLQHIHDLDTLPQTDVVYSVIVLQHNPPPIIAIILNALLRSLKPGGVAFIQVPTYQLGYSFSLQTYLNTAATQQKLEMHVLPQSEVFEIVRQAGASVLEVLEDNWTGFGYNSVSNTFLIQKRAGTV
jgi:2-polyprenyl-3-methyl-5-hydroxy-6-metoxy-1,4-benzoquinol methylase